MKASTSEDCGSSKQTRFYYSRARQCNSDISAMLVPSPSGLSKAQLSLNKYIKQHFNDWILFDNCLNYLLVSDAISLSNGRFILPKVVPSKQDIYQ